MTQHTQGEWGIASINNGESFEIVAHLPDGNIVNIAEMIGHGSFQTDEGLEYEVTKEEAAANARLLGGASGLLVALRRLVDAYGVAGIALYDDAKKAIAEATGE